MRIVFRWILLIFSSWVVQSVTWAATATNLPPTISGTPTSSIVSNSAYAFTPIAEDPEGAKLKFSIVKLPKWARFNVATGALTGTPTGSQAGVYSGITIIASDGKLKSSLGPFSIEVSNPPPEISGTPATHAVINTDYSFVPVASDPNGDSLTFSIVNKPKWAAFSKKTGVLTGKLASKHIGITKGVVISVTDGKTKVSLPAFDLQVTQSIPNAPPTLTGIPSGKASVGNLYGFIPTANDQDNDPLTFSIVNLPTWATFDTSTGKLVGTPTTGDIGKTTSDIVISVTDGKSSPVSLEKFNIDVIAPINIAHQFGVASQGKDYDDASMASLSIDGDMSTFNHTTCDATNNWWQVKLPEPTAVSTLVITSRSSWTSRIKDAAVYITNSAYNGTLSDADKVATLISTSAAQTTTFATPKSGSYVIVKAAGENCLHMAEVEVYGQTPVTPVFAQQSYSFLLAQGIANGTLVGQIKAVDYQLDTMTYGLEGAVPFTVDSQGKLRVNGAPQAGMTYAFNATVSDGSNVARVPVTVKVTAATAVEDALRTGDASVATTDELLGAVITELAGKKVASPLLTALYGTGDIAYTPGHNTQLMDVHSWVDSAFPILFGVKGNTLAMAGKTATARYAAFGVPPTDLFKSSQSLGFELPFGRLLAWLLAGEPVNSAILNDNRTVALSMTSSSSRNNFKAWIAQKYPSWTIVDCNSMAAMASCYSAASLVVTDGGSSSSSDASTVKQVLTDVMAVGKPVLYLHTGTWGSNDVSNAVASLMHFNLPYGGNWWADDAANWANITAMQSAIWDNQGLAGIEKMLNHFKNNDYSMSTRETEFYPGANKVRTVMTGLDESKINLFAEKGSRLYRLLALLGDSYRQGIHFPMDQAATDANVFFRSLFSDHAIYNYRSLNPVQADLGNFSRSNFSHITPITKTVNMTSRQNFRAAGVYALPGQTLRVTRRDNSATTTKVFINTLRSGSTHEYEAWGYKRPKYLQSARVPIKAGETIALTSPYGGPVQIEFSANDIPVSFTFEQVGEHPFWDDASDNATFTSKLAAGEYDWAEFITPAFEIHSTLEKMRESASDSRWGGTLDGFAAATMRYIHNFPHVLAGFKGSGIDGQNSDTQEQRDRVAEIYTFATNNGYEIENLDLVKHMNADQATCGSGCSGNPYDAYWAFDPIGHGDIHELGHGLEKGLFRLAGWDYHASTNPYSYYSKTQFVKDRLLAGEALANIDPDCQALPFKEVFTALQASVGQSDPAAYLQTNLWANSGWSHQVSMTIQMMMAAEHQGVLADGWHLLARLHILEREFRRAIASESGWESKKASLGFSTYTFTEAKALVDGNRSSSIYNDWMIIAVSKVTGLDYRDYFSMWGQAYSEKASTQLAGLNYPAVERRFFISSPNGYCKGEGFDGNNLLVDGHQVWPLSAAQPRLMGGSFR